MAAPCVVLYLAVGKSPTAGASSEVSSGGCSLIFCKPMDLCQIHSTRLHFSGARGGAVTVDGLADVSLLRRSAFLVLGWRSQLSVPVQLCLASRPQWICSLWLSGPRQALYLGFIGMVCLCIGQCERQWTPWNSPGFKWLRVRLKIIRPI